MVLLSFDLAAAPGHVGYRAKVEETEQGEGSAERGIIERVQLL